MARRAIINQAVSSKEKECSHYDAAHFKLFRDGTLSRSSGCVCSAGNAVAAATHFQTMAFSLALYLAFPFIQITCTPLVLRGVGIRT